MKIIHKPYDFKYLTILYWVTRIMFALTFIISGSRKLPGVKFTTLSIDNPVGFYFEAMFQTGVYWNFIGFLQILLGALIIINRLVVAVSLFMMIITFNIWIISISLGMQGTPLITSLMLMGNIYLLFYNFENYKNLFRKPIRKTLL